MLWYLVNVLRAFMPLSLIAGMLLALGTPIYGRRALRPVILGLTAGLSAGMILYFISSGQEWVTAARTALNAAAALAAAASAGIFILPGYRHGTVGFLGWGAALFFTAALSATAIFSFLAMVTEQALSAISVLNTEFIQNIAGILAGASLIVFLIPLTARISAKNERGIIPVFFLFASLLLILQWCAEVLLGLMRLEMIELTTTRLSLIAKVSKYSGVFPYIQALLLAALSLLFFARRTVLKPQDISGMEKAERRKARSRVLFERRWFEAALVAGSIIFAVLLYHDLYASRPPQISPPVNLRPDPGGWIRVKISDLADGNLQRFSYVTDDGHVVRFFIIRSGRRVGVVYDACMLCGDRGYIQEKNEVVCIACNVRIFIPSIGKPGGCNPIPLTHKVEGDHIVIPIEELEKGARYFSQVVSRKVKDPVTGGELDNHQAPYRYEYKGRTYFFSSEESKEKFKKSPETYVREQPSRYDRLPGYRGR